MYKHPAANRDHESYGYPKCEIDGDDRGALIMMPSPEGVRRSHEQELDILHGVGERALSDTELLAKFKNPNLGYCEPIKEV